MDTKGGYIFHLESETSKPDKIALIYIIYKICTVQIYIV